MNILHIIKQITIMSHPLFEEALVFQSQITLLLNPYSVRVRRPKVRIQRYFFLFRLQCDWRVFVCF